MKKVTALIISAAAVFLLIQPALHAEPQDRMRPKEPAQAISDEQMKKMAELDRSFEMQRLDIKEKLAPKHIQLQKLLLADEVDMNKVKALLKEIAGLKADLEILNIQHRIEADKLFPDGRKFRMRPHHMHGQEKEGRQPFAMDMGDHMDEGEGPNDMPPCM
jgi:hypothetical protein